MTELLPSLQALRLRDGLVDYLTTTFALADAEPRQALTDFLQDPDSGIFKGPYVRLRLPFHTADSAGDSPLDWQPPFPPYRHQEEAHRHLTSKDLRPDKPRPLPTIVTTGTGSGKTEAFLNPIIDHVLRARRDGITGMKALILYPMNALADDQAGRLTKLITTDPKLANVTAGLYTGDANPGQGQGRSKVAKEGLITNRTTMRDTPPDILLTNYKMLDQLLLRPEDAPLWSQSALSLTYLVLDEFHTYDGAQGTDVAMLLRRLGLRLRSHVPEDHPDRPLFDACPLGRVTPVATSATLGDGGDPTAMLDFAAQVFGEPFDRSAAITERRVDAETYSEAARTTVTEHALRRRRLFSMLSTEVAEIADLARVCEDDGDRLVAEVARRLYGPGPAPEHLTAATLLRAHDDIRAFVDDAAEAVPLADLAAQAFGSQIDDNDKQQAVATILAALSHIRLADRGAVSVEVTQWIRELTRLDRVVSAQPAFRWSDDGPPIDDAQTIALPAIFCRSCGRSGWGVSLAPTGRDLAASDNNIRAEHLWKTGRFRALLHAPGEAALVADKRSQGDPQPEQHAPNLRWLDVGKRALLLHAPAEDDEDLLEGRILPVVMLDGDTEDIERRSKSDDCPSCGKRDQIRFLGSAIATLLSVSLSTLFGDAALDPGEKRALVFTDSVQDAAHRAGFVDTRSHTLSLRAALRDGLDKPMSLVEWTDEVLRRADGDGFARYRLVPRSLLDNEFFHSYWSANSPSRIPASGRTAMRRRLLFDIELEVGLQASYGRTLEATGSIGVQVNAGNPERVAGFGRRACATDGTDTLPIGHVDDTALRRWVHGTLEHLRRDGAIEHDWLRRYVQHDGGRIWVWGKRRRDQGAPAFPPGRGAPAFAITDGSVDPKSDFVRVTSPQSWYARWAQKCLGVNTAHGATLAARLLKELSKADVVRETNTDKGAHAFGLTPDVVRAVPLSDEELRDRVTLVVCDTCHSPVPTTPELGDLFAGGPCTTDRCRGTLKAAPRDPNSFYRNLFANSDMRRVDAHEHTSLIDPVERRHIEAGFKRTDQSPGDPNVLVATPTLEMGIDIGDLTTVMLSSLPDSVAKYVQRVGRAGRLTGSSLALAYVTGRGDQLPQLGEPLSMINGTVRPPATYLDAEEILRRQFLAHVIDDLVRSGHVDVPRTTGEALASTDPGTFLGTVIDRVEHDGVRLLEDFVGTFAHRDTAGIAMLRTWVLAPDGEPDTFAATVHHAAHEHRSEVEELRRRRTAVVDAIPGLRERAELPAASDDDRTAYRSAVGTAKLVKRVLSDITGSPWISGLEMRGLLPNYSLLDDTVELDAQISWIDPETERFDSDSLVIPRGSARALTELAPGAHFYAHGLELRVDGIEIGQDQAEVAHYALCDECGHLKEFEAATDPSPTSCPRCGSTGIADTGQRFDAVRLKRVFSEVRRDDAKITDNDDLRHSQRFEVLVAVDFDPARLVEQWSVEAAGLGVSHYRRLPVRWFNLGRSSNAPSTRILAGRDVAAQLFRVCEICGKLDQEAGTNSPHEHRAWCPHRTAVDEHTREFGLSRELVTQAIAISLPPSVTADQFSVPSLQAALLLGLREIIGGAPDHLRVEVVPQPLGTGDGATRTALLLHDIVPGGTGYLTDVAGAERLWAILLRAARTLEDCPCQYEERAACHRCLLPFTHDSSSVTRLDAIRALRVLLEIDEETSAHALEIDAPTWDVTDRPIDADWGESTLEQKFRNALKERLAKNTDVKESTGPNGAELRISSGGRQWRLRPQVLISQTKPDFELTASGGAGRYAIYTDGHAYHAVPAVNRLADDAEKRERLRSQGIQVIAVAWGDIDDPTRPVWLNDQVIAALRKTPQGAGISQAVVQEYAGGPLALLEGIVHNPTDPARTMLARNLPFLLAQRPGFRRGWIGPDQDLLRVADSLLAEPERELDTAGDSLIVHRSEHLVLACRLKGIAPVEVALVFDDTETAVASPDHVDAWHAWLELSNVIGLSDIEARISVRSLVEKDAKATGGAPVSTVDEAAWDGSDLGGLGSTAKRVAALLAAAGVAQPDIMSEVDGIMVDLTWREQRVAVLDAEAPADDLEDLRGSGWKVVRLDLTAPEQLAQDVRNALDEQKG
ncbi:DEAD/DEAH box helicase [Flexivirga oryzae]|uniref:ATP-dependent helicase YprA (DUF1998 family) n=1 Tax=Flexivirga oryzae TaxID=1794944 RepID=A0A839N7L0_9MICO|nr:DEAD/DEAH box helicase [Flexivirga oryzae]MBB2890652.1 ATP-dependent helicase YprA (DUF1998 family) [Flexivirga oryzae]